VTEENPMSAEVQGGGKWALAAPAILLLLAAVGGGFYLAVGQWDAARQTEPSRTEAGPPAPTPAPVEAPRPPPEPQAPTDQPRTFAGKVVRPAGTKEGADGLALVTDGGTARPLVRDGVSEMLFQDARLRDRPVRLTAVSVSGSGALRVVRVQTVRDGEVCDVDYWCDVCQISLPHPGSCYCCGDEVVLRERPTR
jgi:hypothetical protein